MWSTRCGRSDVRRERRRELREQRLHRPARRRRSRVGLGERGRRPGHLALNASIAPAPSADAQRAPVEVPCWSRNERPAPTRPPPRLERENLLRGSDCGCCLKKRLLDICCRRKLSASRRRRIARTTILEAKSPITTLPRKTNRSVVLALCRRNGYVVFAGADRRGLARRGVPCTLAAAPTSARLRTCTAAPGFLGSSSSRTDMMRAVRARVRRRRAADAARDRPRFGSCVSSRVLGARFGCPAPSARHRRRAAPCPRHPSRSGRALCVRSTIWRVPRPRSRVDTRDPRPRRRPRRRRTPVRADPNSSRFRRDSSASAHPDHGLTWRPPLVFRQPPDAISPATAGLKAYELRKKSKGDLLNQLKELKTELAALRVAKVTGGAPNKLSKIKVVRLRPSRRCSLARTSSRTCVRRRGKSTLDLRPKKTRARSAAG